MSGVEVLAWARRWYVDGETPKKERNANGRLAWPQKFTFHEVTKAKCFADDVALQPSPSVPTEGLDAAVVVWRSPDEVPSVKAGEYAYRIVAVRRAHNGEVYSFGACYLNAVSLWFEDGNESREITGWNSEEGGDEPIYAPLLRDGDDLVGWCEYPIHSAATPQPADGRSSNEGAGE